MVANAAFIDSCVTKYLLRRRAASSNAIVVRCRSAEPKSRIIRSRRSSLCNRMKIETTMTIPRVASGDRTGDRYRSANAIGEAALSWLAFPASFDGPLDDPRSTGRPLDAPGLGALLLEPSWSSNPETRSIVTARTLCIFVSIVPVYSGNRVARLATWDPITAPIRITIPIARATATNTEATRPNRMRRNRFAKGASTNDRRTASVIGMSTSRPR